MRSLLFVMLTLVIVPAAVAQTNPYTWQIGTGTWNTPANWLNGSAVAEVPPSNVATQLVFNATGTTSYTSTNNVGAATFSLNRMTFNNTGTGVISVAGSVAANTFTFAGTTPTIDVQAGTAQMLGLMAGSAIITKIGAGTFIHDSNNTAFTGQIIINAGTFINRATAVAVTNFNPTLITVNSGGTYQFGAAAVGDPNLPATTYVTVNTGGMVNWQEGEAFGGFHLQGGTIDLVQGSPSSGGTTAQTWTHGTLTGTGISAFVVGGATAINKTTTGTVTVTGNASINTSTGGLNIQNGIITHVNANNLGTSNVTLGAAGTAGTFEYQGVSATRAGIFTQVEGFINVTQASTTLTLSGSTAGSGLLTKSGPGTLHLTGTAGAGGTTRIINGIFRVNPGIASGNFAIDNPGILAVNSGTGATTFSMTQLEFQNTNSVLQLELDTAALPAAALATVVNADALVFNTAPILRLNNLQPFANGTYTLIDYSGAAITSGYTLQLPGRTAGMLVYNSAATTIEANITGTDTVKWTGLINSDWNVGTEPGTGGTNNWQTVIGGTATNFIQTDTVTFDDSTSNRDVTVTTTVFPAGITINSAMTYTFTGTGKISGGTALAKVGNATAILATDNDYTGGTTVTGGTLQLGNGGATGSIAGTITLNGAILAFNRTANLAVANSFTFNGSAGFVQNSTAAIAVSSALNLGGNGFSLAGNGAGTVSLDGLVTGTGTITKSGSSTFTLTSASTGFTGNLIIDGGTFQLDANGGSGDVNPVLITVNSTGTFQFGPNGNPDLPATFIDVNGGTFEISVGETFGALRVAGGTVRVVGDGALFQNPSPSSVAAAAGFDGTRIESGTFVTTGTGTNRALIDGNATFPIRKVTAGTVTFTGSWGFDTNTPLFIEEGVFEMLAFNVPSDTPTTAITFGTASTSATLRITDAATATIPRVTTFTGGATYDIAMAGGQLTLSGNLGGGGGLTKAGPGRLILTGAANAYSGGTVINGGSLIVNSPAGTGSGPVSVNAGGTLGGTGSVTGAISIAAGGTIAAGSSVGTLTINSLDFTAGGRIGAFIADGTTPAAGSTGGSTLGALPNPTSNNFLNKTGGTLTGMETVNVVVDLNGITFFDPLAEYSYRIGQGFGDLALLNINDPARFTFVNAGGNAPVSASLTGNDQGALFLNFTPTPEPCGLLALGVVAVGLAIRRRR